MAVVICARRRQRLTVEEVQEQGEGPVRCEHRHLVASAPHGHQSQPFLVLHRPPRHLLLVVPRPPPSPALPSPLRLLLLRPKPHGVDAVPRRRHRHPPVRVAAADADQLFKLTSSIKSYMVK